MTHPSIVEHLQKRLRKIFGDNSIRLAEFRESTGYYGFVNCKGFVHRIDEETKHNLGLLPFRVANSTDYWLSIILSFNTATQDLKHVSLTIYEDSFIKLFRAEWADNDSSIVHAQPHWHVHDYIQDSNWETWDIEEISTFSEENYIIKDQIKKIHFAMAASWHISPNHVVPLATCQDKNVIDWINGALNYINEQLTYLHNKSMV